MPPCAYPIICQAYFCGSGHDICRWLSLPPSHPSAGEKLIGAKAYRVIFALGSLPLAIVAIVYFINHRYEGLALWNLRDVPGLHSLVWILNFVSFFFLYPSTFNILEVRLGRWTI